MLTKIQLLTMLTLQDKINTKVNPDWKEADNDWLLAASQECSEAIDHHGWKWWKHQEPDMAQLQMELVDIWHFGLSEACLNTALYKDLLNPVKTKPDTSFLSNTLIHNLKLFQKNLLDGIFYVDLFYSICEQSKLPSEDLFKQYVGKNVLNMFRQNHGYKTGSYIKTWFDGREDNEHLTELLESISVDDPSYSVLLYTALKERYTKNK